MGRSVRILLRNGDEKTYENAAFHADVGKRQLIVTATGVRSVIPGQAEKRMPDHCSQSVASAA